MYYRTRVAQNSEVTYFFGPHEHCSIEYIYVPPHLLNLTCTMHYWICTKCQASPSGLQTGVFALSGKPAHSVMYSVLLAVFFFFPSVWTRNIRAKGGVQWYATFVKASSDSQRNPWHIWVLLALQKYSSGEIEVSVTFSISSSLFVGGSFFLV